MLLMDAIEGPGFYARTVSEKNQAFLEVAERLYGCSSEEGVRVWLTMGHTFGPVEWPQ